MKNTTQGYHHVTHVRQHITAKVEKLLWDGREGGGGKILWESCLQRHPTITLLMSPTLLFYFVQHQAIFLVKGRMLLPINGTLNINEK